MWHIFLVCGTLGFVRLSRIHRHSASTSLVRCHLLGVPPQLYPITTNNLPWDRCWNSHCVDGTKNFVHGFPFICISLGLIDHRVPILGVIYNPFLLYTGVCGVGSFLQNRSQRWQQYNATATPACTDKCKAAAITDRRAHHSQVGLGSRTGAGTMQSR